MEVIRRSRLGSLGESGVMLGGFPVLLPAGLGLCGDAIPRTRDESASLYFRYLLKVKRKKVAMVPDLAQELMRLGTLLAIIIPYLT